MVLHALLFLRCSLRQLLLLRVQLRLLSGSHPLFFPAGVLFFLSLLELALSFNPPLLPFPRAYYRLSPCDRSRQTLCLNDQYLITTSFLNYLEFLFLECFF